jgi:uncharacterized protein DUF397
MRMLILIGGARKRSSATSQVLRWTKSSFSMANGNCVEVAGLSSELVRVRDSKNPGPVLEFSPERWSAFIRDVQAGGFDRNADH